MSGFDINRGIVRLSDVLAFVEGPASNWLISGGSDSWILIDGGYPKDIELVIDSAHSLGIYSLPDAVLITHAHIDHLGASLYYATKGVKTFCSNLEVNNATGVSYEQINVEHAFDMANDSAIWRSWVNHAISLGGLTNDRLDPALVESFEPSSVEYLNLIGNPIPFPSPGHTKGHTSYIIGDVLISGDALVTGHPTSDIFETIQILDPLFNSDNATALDTVQSLLSLGCKTLAPGHGPTMSLDMIPFEVGINGK